MIPFWPDQERSQLFRLFLLLIFVGVFIQTPIIGIRALGIILGIFCELLGIAAILFINGYIPALNRGYTPNKMKYGIRLMKIVNKDTMELREVDEEDLGMLLLRAIIGWFEAFLVLPIVPGLLSLAIMNSSENNQRLADIIVGTVVVKVDPVETVNIKDFRMKKDELPPTFDGVLTTNAYKTDSAIYTDISVKEPIIDRKLANKPIVNIFSDHKLIVAGKWVFISSAIYLILAQIVHLISYTLETVNTSMNIFGEVLPFNKTASGLDNVLNIISYFVLFISCVGFVLYYLGIKNSDTKKPLLFTAIFYGLFIIFRIIYMEANWANEKVIAFIDLPFGNIVSYKLSSGELTFEILSTICIIAALFILNSFIRSFNEEHKSKVRRFRSHIILIIFFTLLLGSYITGINGEPTVVLGIVIFFCVSLFKIKLSFAYIEVFSELIKMRKIETFNPEDSGMKKSDPYSASENRSYNMIGEDIFAYRTLVVVGKWIFISSAIYLILAQIVHFISYSLIKVNTSFYIFGEEKPIVVTLSELDNILNISSYIVLFLCCIGFILFYFGIKSPKTKRPLLVATIFFVLFVIFRIIYLEANWSGEGFNAYIFFEFGNLHKFSLTNGEFVLQILSTTCIIVALFILNKFIQAFNDEHHSKVRTFGGQIYLIKFFVFLFVIYCIAMNSNLKEIPALVVFFLIAIFQIKLTFAYLGTFSELIKMRKFTIVG